jgi:hypothetical protein
VVCMGAVDAKVESLMSERMFRSTVGGIIGRRISRTWLWELRREIEMGDEEFTPTYARIIAYYAKLRSTNRTPSTARRMTIEFCKENDL